MAWRKLQVNTEHQLAGLYRALGREEEAEKMGADLKVQGAGGWPGVLVCGGGGVCGVGGVGWGRGWCPTVRAGLLNVTASQRPHNAWGPLGRVPPSTGCPPPLCRAPVRLWGASAS